MDLAELFIVSRVSVSAQPVEGARQGVNVPCISVAVSEAPCVKCPRGWLHSTEAGENGLCPRCAKVLTFVK